MDLWSLLDEEKKEPEKVKKVKKEVEQVADQQPAPVAKAEKQVTKVVEEPKKEEKPAGKKETKKAVPAGSYKYPFGIYSEGRMIDVSSYGFVDGQDYTEKEITDIMLQHRHYEFAGTMEYSYIEDDNVLVVTGKQHRKG